MVGSGKGCRVDAGLTLLLEEITTAPESSPHPTPHQGSHHSAPPLPTDQNLRESGFGLENAYNNFRPTLETVDSGTEVTQLRAAPTL